jgi:hypothetical protein
MAKLKVAAVGTSAGIVTMPKRSVHCWRRSQTYGSEDTCGKFVV